jgi:hypothetical protein
MIFGSLKTFARFKGEKFADEHQVLSQCIPLLS